MNASLADARRPSITVENAADIKLDTRRRDTNYVRFIIVAIAATLPGRSSPPKSAETTSATRKTRTTSNAPNATTPSQLSKCCKSTKTTALRLREPWSGYGRRQNVRGGSWSKVMAVRTKVATQTRTKKKWSRTQVAKIATSSWWMSAMIGGVLTAAMAFAQIAVWARLMLTCWPAPSHTRESTRTSTGTPTEKEKKKKSDIACLVWSLTKLSTSLSLLCSFFASSEITNTQTGRRCDPKICTFFKCVLLNQLTNP